MTGNQVQGARWSTRQRLVVLTFDTPRQAEAFDVGGLLPADVLGALDRVGDGLLLDLGHACRDLLDVWDDGELAGGEHDLDTLNGRVEAIRRALFELRQAALT